VGGGGAVVADGEKTDFISSYLGRCPVLKWGRYWRQTGWMVDPVSWGQIRG